FNDCIRRAEQVKIKKQQYERNEVNEERSLDEGPAWPEPLAPEALHGLAGDIVRLIIPASEADPVALLMQFLVAFGSILGRTAYFLVEGTRHYANEFLVLVGETSKARKGTSWNRVFGILRAAEVEWAKERVQTGLSSGEGLIHAVRDPVVTQEK